MGQYLSPGVYVEEVPSAIKPIVGVGTSTAGFIGFVADEIKMKMPPIPGQFEFEKDENGNVKRDENGKSILKRGEDGNPIPVLYTVATAGEPVLVSNWEEFMNKFGDVQAENKMLANAVYGFFSNGGTRSWVTRVTDLKASQTAVAARKQAKATAAAGDQVKEALAKFEAIDEIALVAVPMATDIGAGDLAANRTRRVAIREMVLEHCEKMQDRFAILDGEETVEGNLDLKSIYQNAAGDAMGKKSNYGAVYYPWIDISGAKDFVPPCGHIVGIYARVDSERGVHKAPANVDIRGARGLKYRVSKAQHDGLNPDGINVIRQFNGTINVWGARTIGGDKNVDFKYVNTRRLFNFLRESIDENTRWVVFEPNDRSLWQKIRRNISAFLTTVWRDGALFGATPEEAFYVKCDETINTEDVRNLGQVITEIGVKIVNPAEFVVFRISQWAGASA
jgi:hypothetical protein